MMTIDQRAGHCGYDGEGSSVVTSLDEWAQLPHAQHVQTGADPK